MGFLLGNQAGWEVGWVSSLQLEGSAGEGCTPERAPGFRGQGHRDAGEGNGPKSRGWCLQEPQVSLQTPLVFSECPLSLGLVGRPLTKSCSRSQVICTLLLPPLGVTPRFQWLLAPLPAQVIYLCLLTSVGDPVVFVIKSG